MAEFKGNPREDPRHRERGPKKFHFTYEDIGRAAGVSLGTARTYASTGRYDPRDLRSVAEFVLRRPKSPA